MQQLVKYLFLLTLLIIPVCSSLAAQEPLKLGAVMYLTSNDYSSVAEEFRRGLELGIKDSAKPMMLLVEDDQALTKNTVSATQKLLTIDQVDVLLFLEFWQARVGAPIASRAKTPSLVIWESSPEIEELGEYVFGLGLWTPSAGAIPAQYAVEEFSARKAALIYDVSGWSTNVAKYFKRRFTELGGRIEMEETHPKGETDFRASIAKLQKKNIDVLFAPISEHPVAFFKQLQQSDFDKPVLASDQISEEFITASNGAMEGLLFSNTSDRLGPGLQKLQKQYREAYQTDPSNIQCVGMAYDVIKMLDIASRAEAELKLHKALLKTREFPGVSAPIALNDSGTFARPEVMYVVKDGKPVQLN